MLEISKEQKERAQALIKAGAIGSVEFSHKTYLVEVIDEGVTYWPFLQLDSEGLQDGFCSCSVASSGEKCAHIGAAYFFLTKKGLPHERFEQSLFKQLGLICFKRHGEGEEYEVSHEGKGVELFSSEGRLLFSLVSKNEKTTAWLKEKVLEKQEETEETSIKFSGLPPEELELWRKGTPSLELGFEISYWSDIFKTLFLKDKCHFSIKKVGKLPEILEIETDTMALSMFMANNNWCEVVSYLDTVDFPYPFHPFQDLEVEKVHYDALAQVMEVVSYEAKGKGREEKVDLGEVYFIEGRGFFPAKEEVKLGSKLQTKEEIIYFFDKHLKILKHHLESYGVHEEPLSFQYKLLVDEKRCLVIETYAFEPGDLKHEETAIFGDWLFIKDKGFFFMGSRPFKALLHKVAAKDVPSFIKEYEAWLEGQLGFALQAATMQVSLSYKVLENRSIQFFRDDAAFERDENMVEFDPYVYVKDRGFFLKAEPREMKYIKAETLVLFHEASLFIKDMKEDLEQINGFFAMNCPIMRRGLNIYLEGSGEIVVEPTTLYAKGYSEDKVTLFGDFSFVEGEGFYLLDKALQLPHEYVMRKVISKENEPFFIQFEINNLAPITIEIDKRLQTVDELDLAIESISPVKDKLGFIEVVMHYESEYGKSSVAEVKDFLSSSLPYKPMDIGLVFFDQPRFYWLKLLAPEAVEEGRVEISILEWIRLRIYQDVKAVGSHKADVLRFIEDIESMNPQDGLNLEGLVSQLRNYQEVGVNWLWGLYSYGLSGILADDMGLGKTHQAMALISAVANSKRGGHMKCLVVCPTSVLYHWEDLLLKFLPSLKAALYYGSNRNLSKVDKNTQILLTSFGTLRSDIKKLQTTPFDLAIFDEVQTAKNISSQIHKALVAIKASSKIGLTGTPIENSLIELKALFDIMLPKYLPSNAQYKEQFVTPIERYGDSSKKALLSKLVHPFILRRRKSEVLDDLPGKTEEIAYCQLLDEQGKLYSDIVSQNSSENYNEKGDIVTLHVFAMLNKLKQVCNHPCMISKDFKGYDDTPCGKWDLFKELFWQTQNSGEKVVVFTQYLDMIKIFENFFTDKGIKYASLQGATRNRREEIERFREDPECRVFIGSLKAAGTGIDLTAGSVVIHYDRWWNPAKENQATDRVHRIGQSRGVQVFKMVTKETIEEYIDELILKKQGLLEAVVGYDETSEVKKIDKDTLKVILDKLSASTNGKK